MSLINQMLQDLERRNAGVASPSRQPIPVQAAPARRKRYWPALLCLMLLALLLWQAQPWLLAWWQQYRTPAAPPPVAEPAPVAPPVAAPAEQQYHALHLLESTLSELPASPSIPATVTRSRPGASNVNRPAKSEAGAVDSKPLTEGRGNSLKQFSPEQQSANQYRQAVDFLQQGRVAEAQALLSQALTADPRNHDARQMLVGLHLDNQRHVQAIALLQQGLQQDPKQTGFSMTLARLQLEAADLTGALVTMQQALPYAADDADYHGFYAALLQREGSHEAAAQHYLTALRTRPENASWLIGLGISWQASGKLADAREAYQRAQQDPGLSSQLAQFVDQRLKQINQRLR
ncbi:tetratricopeptide repeat protein [Methylobacillus flagellatus]|uniref:tetratricopeptide repeat protein n=1 Tax=Methylobacillus flagellatus TaxID=405 RepID=UPI0010F4DF0B|nr:tetratricopeptide repeat protein [Methylobacillus flagellatus]